MSLSLTCILTALLAVSSADWDNGVKTAVKAHYDSILTGRALGWQLEIRRIPPIRSDWFEIVGVREDEGDRIPRGSRLCWIEAIVDENKRMLPVSLKISLTELAPVASQVIPARTLLTDSLVTWKPIETTMLGATRLPRKNEINNLWAKVRIPAGVLITMPRLSPPPVITIGQELSLVSRIGIVEARVDGKALEDGRLGEKIRVLNTLNGEKFRGVVESEKTVVLE